MALVVLVVAASARAVGVTGVTSTGDDQRAGQLVGDRLFDGRRPDGGRVALTHADCGEPITVEVRCAEGHPVTVDGIEAARRR